MKKTIAHLFYTPTWVSIFLGSLLLLWQLWAGALSDSVQVTFFAFFIFATGIPHGALDHLVEKETASRERKPFNLLVFLAKYLATMLFYTVVWFFVPTASLFFFLLISAWHFGETDLENAPNTPLWNAARFLFGVLVLSSLLLTHASETAPFWSRITQNAPISMSVWQFSVENKILILSILSLIFLVVFVQANRKSPVVFDKNRLFRLVLILTLAYFLPLLPAFALYFGGWHALCAFKSIYEYLTAQNPQASPLSIWLKSVPFTLLAFAFLAFALWYWQHFFQSFDPLPMLFVFLSLITLPHLGVMHSMNSKKA